MFLILIVAHVAIVAALVGVLARTSSERRAASEVRDRTPALATASETAAYRPRARR